jgi:hypothetical protein
MALFLYLVLAICCRLGQSLGAFPVGTQHSEKNGAAHISLTRQESRGPLKRQEPEGHRISAHRHASKKTVSFIDARGHRVSEEEIPQIAVYKDTDCMEKSFSLQLPLRTDWTEEGKECQGAKLNTTAESTSTVSTVASSDSHQAERAILDGLLQVATKDLPAIQVKLTCDDGGAILIYSETDEGCLEHTTRYVMIGSETAGLAKGGSCMSAKKEEGAKPDAEPTEVSVMFKTIDDATVFPECFEPGSFLGLPLPGFLTKTFGKTGTIVLFSSIGLLFLFIAIWIVWKFTRKPKDQQLGEYGGEGYGGYGEQQQQFVG